jgi:hypothetical protein
MTEGFRQVAKGKPLLELSKFRSELSQFHSES